jgi:hypothetical protein
LPPASRRRPIDPPIKGKLSAPATRAFLSASPPPAHLARDAGVGAGGGYRHSRPEFSKRDRGFRESRSTEKLVVRLLQNRRLSGCGGRGRGRHRHQHQQHQQQQQLQQERPRGIRRAEEFRLRFRGTRYYRATESYVRASSLFSRANYFAVLKGCIRIISASWTAARTLTAGQSSLSAGLFLLLRLLLWLLLLLPPLLHPPSVPGPTVPPPLATLATLSTFTTPAIASRKFPALKGKVSLVPLYNISY